MQFRGFQIPKKICELPTGKKFCVEPVISGPATSINHETSSVLLIQGIMKNPSEKNVAHIMERKLAASSLSMSGGENISSQVGRHKAD